MYSDDSTLHFECLKISKLLTDNIYTPPKQYLLKVRAELPKYFSHTEEADMKAAIEIINNLQKEYHEELSQAMENIEDGVESFYNYFRTEYARQITNKSPQITSDDHDHDS